MSDKTGGPAFPTENARKTGVNSWHEEGMTLRDYFAAKAMTMFEWSMMTQADGKNIMDSFTAERCYMVADAMLKAKKE